MRVKNFMMNTCALGCLWLITSCKTPNSGQGSLSDDASGASAGRYDACDRSAERVLKANEKLERLRERFSLLRALAEIGPNTATVVTRNAVDSNQLPSEYASQNNLPSSPEQSNPASEALVKEFSTKNLVREMMTLAQEVVEASKGSQKESVRSEMVSELKILVSQLSEQISQKEASTDRKRELLEMRLVARVTLTSLDVNAKEGMDAKELVAELNEIQKNNGNQEILRELAFAELLAKVSESANQQKVKALVAELNKQIARISSNSVERIVVARLDAGHSSLGHCGNMNGCSEKRAAALDVTLDEQVKVAEKVASLKLESEKLFQERSKMEKLAAYEGKFNRLTIERNRELIERGMEKIGAKPSERRMEVKRK